MANGWSFLSACAVLLGLSGCAEMPEQRSDAEAGAEAALATVDADVQQTARELLLTPVGDRSAWAMFPLPGKRQVHFESTTVQGRQALKVRARTSVSILRKQFSPALPQPNRLRFSWRVDGLPVGAELSQAEHADSAVRIVLTFSGDRSRWSARNHRLSELSHLLTGEALPYATLAYVWSHHDALGAVVHNPRTDRIRKLVVESGAQHVGQWRDYERDIRADFIRAFGEEPGDLQAVALMTDTDNTRSSLQAWYGSLKLEVAGATP